MVQESILPQDGTPYFTCHQTSGPREPSFQPLQIRRDFFAETLRCSWQNGIFQDSNSFPRHILRKGGKGIFQYFRRFLFMGGSILTCEWIGIGVASYSPTKKAFRRPRRILPGEVVWVAQTGDHHGDVTNFLLVNVVEKTAMVQLSGADHVFLHRGQTGDLHIILVLSSVEESFSQRLHFSSESSRNHDYP